MRKTVEHDGKKVAIEATIRSFGLARFVSIDWRLLQTKVKKDPRIVVEIALKLGTPIVYQDGQSLPIKGGFFHFFLTTEAKSLSLVQFYFSLAHNGYAHLYLYS